MAVIKQEMFALNHWRFPLVGKVIYNNVLYMSIAHEMVNAIPIIDVTEVKLVDLLEVNNTRIKPIASFNYNYKKNYEGYSKIRSSLYKRLLKMLQFLPSNIGIAYFGGLRPIYKQKEYFDKKFIEIFNELNDKELAYKETSKHVSPFIDNIPAHCTGAAIDITLFSISDQHEQLMDMGKIGTLDGANNQQETFSRNISLKQRNNRLLLLSAATRSGLVNYGFEWWHYSYGDKAWAYVKGKNAAIYGLAVESHDPILFMDKKTYLKRMVL